MTKNMIAAVAALGLMIGVSGGAHAAISFQNGGFETLTSGPGQLGFNTNATGWTTTGYNFVFTKGTADSTGATGQYGNLKLWGPNSKPINGFSAPQNGFPASSPDGGNFVGADGAYGTKSIDQTINGLTVGHNYAVGFYWGAAQQYSYNGATTELWTVSLGTAKQATAIDSIASHGFSGWKHETFNYKATAGSEVLSFLATGTPTGVPPFALLDGVTMVDTTVPEPSSLAAIFAGVLGVGAIVRRRRGAKKSAA